MLDKRGKKANDDLIARYHVGIIGSLRNDHDEMAKKDWRAIAKQQLCKTKT